MKPILPLFVQAEPIEAASFAAYGEVVQHSGDAVRHELNVPFLGASDGIPAMWINRLNGFGDNLLKVGSMERHPNSAQTFIPLFPTRCLAVTALSDENGDLDPATLRAFVLAKGQGVSYRPRVWHFGFTSLEADNEVVVMMSRTGGREDTEIIKLQNVVQVNLNIAQVQHVK